MENTAGPLGSAAPEAPHSSPADKVEQTGLAEAVIKQYLLEHLEIYRELCELREIGHNSENCEAFFQKRRSQADNANKKTQKGFFNLMKSIGHELDDATSALTIPRRSWPRPSILDLCMAPGGFSCAALQRNGRTAMVRGISLPPAQGGHHMRLYDVSKQDTFAATKFVDYRDITLLSEEMGVPLSDIPMLHPDFAQFSSDRPYLGREFDLVFCDGQVLRTHERGEHREEHETVRLLTSQLVLGLQRIRKGGNMVVLMHRADAWPTVRLVYTFNLFSDSVVLFKPTKGHKLMSSFYLVAKGIDPKLEAAITAVERWKAQWKAATLGEDWEALERTEDMNAEAVLEKFGEELLLLTEPVFHVQAETLRNSPWVRKLRQEEKSKRERESKDEALALQLGVLGLGTDSEGEGH